MEYKQVIVIRSDLKLSKGKLAAQVAHASLGTYRNALQTHKKAVEEWENSGEKKVVLKVEGLAELHEIKKKAGQFGLPLCLISDAGRTELPAGTTTALGIGPAKESEIDKITGHLKMA
jgi:peptidyl-tRNA hydrolase, PTH2 family